jgi:hypothetical protein
MSQSWNPAAKAARMKSETSWLKQGGETINLELKRKVRRDQEIKQGVTQVRLQLENNQIF